MKLTKVVIGLRFRQFQDAQVKARLSMNSCRTYMKRLKVV